MFACCDTDDECDQSPEYLRAEFACQISQMKSDCHWGECYYLRLLPWIKSAYQEQNQDLRHEGELAMIEPSVRSVHYQLGIIIAFFCWYR